ncbi:uncharacterized protein METZ01_LOCUS93095, partial [marine metagenome]
MDKERVYLVPSGEDQQQHPQGPPPVLSPDAEMFMRGQHIFMGEVTQETMKPLMDWIIAENFNRERKQKELTLGICSPGGDLNACFALVDIM